MSDPERTGSEQLWSDSDLPVKIGGVVAVALSFPPLFLGVLRSDSQLIAAAVLMLICGGWVVTIAVDEVMKDAE